jgi:hypothetical protein
MNIIKKVPFHPLIFAPYPVLALAAANMGWVTNLKFYWALVASFLVMALTFGISWLLIKNTRKAAAITTLILALFFTYGHIYKFIAKNTSPILWFTALWVVLLISGVWWILSLQNKMHDVTHALNWVSILLLLFPLITLGVDYIRDLQNKAQNDDNLPKPSFEYSLSSEASSTLPDIYFIILDGYARADTLTEIYNYDNQPLLNYLQERGFYVAEESFANYHHTVLSLSSTLNMAYIKDLLDAEGVHSYDYARIVDYVHNNKVFALAADTGYQLVTFSSGHAVSEIRHVDHYMRPEWIAVTGASTNDDSKKQIQLGQFEIKLLETTALRPFLPVIFKENVENPMYEDHRQHILYTFSNLATFAQEEGPFFVFAHIIAPHPPFVFQADGEPKLNWRPFTYSEGSHWVGPIGTRVEYIEGYRDQLNYINSLLMKAIDEILTQSENPPVIIIQGDHGPGAFFEWQSITRTNLPERMSILNAIYFPGGDKGWLYPSITPVNTFSVVFNRYLGQDFELSEDRAYFSKWGRPFEFTEVTDLVQ